MEDGDKQIKIVQRENGKIEFLQRFIACSMFIFQSIWIRYCSILFDGNHGQYLERQFYYVLYCGSFFWLLYLVI